MIRAMCAMARAAAVVAMLSASATWGANPIPLEAICEDGPSGRVVNPVRLQYFALKGVDPGVLDADMTDGTTPEELFAALTNFRFCDPGHYPRKEACPAVERRKLAESRNVLESFQRGHPGVRVTFLREPTEEEIERQPGLRAETFAPLIDERRRFVTMACQPARIGSARARGAGGQPGSGFDPGVFLLTSEIEALSLPRETRAQLQKIPQAQVSYVDDKQAKTNTFFVNATAGLRIIDAGLTTVTPFAQFIRRHVRDTTGVQDADETSKLTLGALASIMVTRDDIVDFAPLYVNDLEDGAEILGARLSWRPGFLYARPSFQQGWNFLCSGNDRGETGRCRIGTQYLSIRTDFQVIGSIGHILDQGSSRALTEGREFVRIGPQMRFVLSGMRGAVRDLSADVSYRHLLRLSGDHRRVNALKAGINYWVAGSDHVSLRYGYERGRDEETLERFNTWLVALGFRF